jgi:hypothetical protein
LPLFECHKPRANFGWNLMKLVKLFKLKSNLNSNLRSNSGSTWKISNHHGVSVIRRKKPSGQTFNFSWKSRQTRVWLRINWGLLESDSRFTFTRTYEQPNNLNVLIIWTFYQTFCKFGHLMKYFDNLTISRIFDKCSDKLDHYRMFDDLTLYPMLGSFGHFIECLEIWKFYRPLIIPMFSQFKHFSECFDDLKILSKVLIIWTLFKYFDSSNALSNTLLIWIFYRIFWSFEHFDHSNI